MRVFRSFQLYVLYLKLNFDFSTFHDMACMAGDMSSEIAVFHNPLLNVLIYFLYNTSVCNVSYILSL